jgi:site-specific DNA recombinase
MEFAIGYIRVSTDEQVKEGISIENQIEKIHRYAEDNNLEIIEICEDQGLSGEKIQNRPGMGRLFELVNNNKIKAVVAYKLDRLFRNASDALNTLNWLKKKKIAFHSITEKIDTHCPLC